MVGDQTQLYYGPSVSRCDILALPAGPPSMPRNFQVSAQTSTSITFTWDAPKDLGGRTDISYELCWQQVGAAQECMTYDTTVATVNGNKCV